MAKKKYAETSKATPAGKKAPTKFGAPDISELKNYDPTKLAKSHPKWVTTKFPSYVVPDGKHEMTSVREFAHGGHAVKITTTYKVEVDGKPVHVHLSVDEDGQVHTHATPFVTYASANDLMKRVLDFYPGTFTGHGGHADHHGHSHAHGGAGA